LKQETLKNQLKTAVAANVRLLASLLAKLHAALQTRNAKTQINN